MIEQGKTFELQGVETGVPRILNRHTSPGMKSARDGDPLLLKTDYFTEIRVVFSTWTN